MDADLTVALIKATVQIDQPINESKRMVGTGFLVSVPRPGGPPQVVLVTAAHVFEKMPAPEVRVGWRTQGTQSNWTYAPANIIIRGVNGPMWTRHASQDIAVIPINVPASFGGQPIPLSVLADDATMATYGVTVGQEMMTLGYPHGLSANTAGFPILRSGRLASYPVGPSTVSPTFLIDLTAVPGNSGGPVYVYSDDNNPRNDFVVGILIKQVEDANERLELGVVTEAAFVRQTIEQVVRQSPAGAGSRPAAPRPASTGPAVNVPGGSTTDSEDMTRSRAGPAGQAAKPSNSGDVPESSQGVVPHGTETEPE